MSLAQETQHEEHSTKKKKNIFGKLPIKIITGYGVWNNMGLQRWIESENYINTAVKKQKKNRQKTVFLFFFFFKLIPSSCDLMNKIIFKLLRQLFIW